MGDLTEEHVREVFSHLAVPKAVYGEGFFDSVAEDVHCTVFGSHPLAGVYLGKEAWQEGTFAPLGRAVQSGVTLEIHHVLISGDWSVLELKASGIAKKGWEVDNRYCWVIQWQAGLIQTVRAYPDSAMVQRLLGEAMEDS